MTDTSQGEWTADYMDEDEIQKRLAAAGGLYFIEACTTDDPWRVHLNMPRLAYEFGLDAGDPRVLFKALLLIVANATGRACRSDPKLDFATVLAETCNEIKNFMTIAYVEAEPDTADVN